MSPAKAPLVLFMAGGTGGHIFPALETARVLQEQGYTVQWLGTATRMEAEIVPRTGITLHCLPVCGLRGKGLLAKLRGVWGLVLATWQALRLMKRLQPALVVGMGGFAAGPGGLAAWLRRVPLLIHEQNSIPGVTNKILARFCKRTLTGFPNVLTQHGADYVGNPIRHEIATIIPPQERYAKRNGKLQVLVMGGSLGARTFNEILPTALFDLKEKVIVHHQTGKNNDGKVRLAYEHAGVEAYVEPFIEDMAAVYAWADLVICRSGALTVAEVMAAGVAALFVPFPHAVDDHQRLNAESLVCAGAAEMIIESELTVSGLSVLLSNLCQSRTYLLKMAQKARQQGRPQATESVVSACVEMINEKNSRRK